MTVAEKLAEINRRQAQIAAAGPLSGEVQKMINYRFRLDWNYYSNRMEGGTLTREETRSIMVGNIDVRRKSVRDVMEMNGHDKVVQEILRIGKGEKRLSEARIKAIHRAIMYGEDEQETGKIGAWKERPNEIINYQDEKIDFCPPAEVPKRIHKLLDRTNADLDHIEAGRKNARHPVLVASDFHIDYLTIHPFYDGNGRTARILTNLLLIAQGFPPLIITDEDKEVYYRYLSDIQTHSSNRELFYSFICDMLLRSLQLVQDAIAGKDLGQEEDIEKELRLIEQQLKLRAEETPVKTDERVKEIIDHNLLPLFNELRANLRPFERLFERKSVLIGLDGKKDKWEQDHEPLAVYYEEAKEQKLVRLECMFFFIELKGIAQRTDISVEFKCSFGRDHYTIEEKLTSQQQKRKYNQLLSREEQDEWIGKIKEAFLKKLKGVANGGE